MSELDDLIRAHRKRQAASAQRIRCAVEPDPEGVRDLLDELRDRATKWVTGYVREVADGGPDLVRVSGRGRAPRGTRKVECIHLTRRESDRQDQGPSFPVDVVVLRDGGVAPYPYRQLGGWGGPVVIIQNRESLQHAIAHYLLGLE